MAETKRLPTSGGNGAGWGGPAKGPGNGSPRHKFTAPGPGRGRYSIEGEIRSARRERHAEEMLELYYALAHDPEESATIRLTAATHLLNRIDGLPVAKVVTAETDPYSMMSDEDLVAEIKRTRAKVELFARLTREDSLGSA